MNQSKLFRYVVGTLGVSYCLAGSFLSTHQKIEELTEAEMLGDLERTSNYYKDELHFEKTKVIKTNYESGTTEVVAGSVIIDATNTVNILDSDNCSSVTDAGSHEVIVNFTQPLGNYIFSVVTDEPIKVIGTNQKDNSLALCFNKPYSGIIKVIFFEQVLVPSVA